MILDIKDLHHNYGDVQALNKLNFSIKKNSIVSILGPSGCGKTTLIRVIAGLEEIQKGEIYIEDAEGKQYNINETLISEGHAYVYEGGKKKLFTS